MLKVQHKFYYQNALKLCFKMGKYKVKLKKCKNKFKIAYNNLHKVLLELLDLH